MNTGTVRILLVDKSSEDAGTLKEFLSQACPPFGVEVAHRLDACLHRLVRGGIDLIPLALALPDGRGLDTLRKVRACTPHLPVVVLPALDDVGTGILALRRSHRSICPRAGWTPDSWRVRCATLSSGNERRKPSERPTMNGHAGRNSSCWVNWPAA